MYRPLTSEFSGRIGTVTLNRPERRNAFSAELMREMIACAQALSARGDIDVILVTGAQGVFSARRAPSASPSSASASAPPRL